MKGWMDTWENETRSYMAALGVCGGVCGYFIAFLSNFDASIWIDFAFIPTMAPNTNCPIK